MSHEYIKIAQERFGEHLEMYPLEEQGWIVANILAKSLEEEIALTEYFSKRLEAWKKTEAK